jgi:hypothetical protein
MLLFLAILAGILFCCALGAVVVQTKARTGRWGLNFNSFRDVFSGKPLLRQVECPQCHSKQPTIRKPANLTEILWGGWTCSTCGAHLDKWGDLRK